MSAEGKRERKFFPTKPKANAYAKKLRGDYDRGERGGIIDVSLSRMAAEAARILEPLGLTILEAAKTIAQQHAANPARETFGERFASFRKANEEGWSDRYKRDMDKVPRWVGERFMAMRVGSITPPIIAEAVKANGASTQKTVDIRARMVRAILTSKAKKGKAKIEIMTTRQCASMLRACESAAERHAVALLLFAGIRPDSDDGEFSRLDWSAVGEREIYVSGEVSKTPADRHIPITPRLRRLLRGRPVEGTVRPANWQRRIQAIRKAAGIGGKQDITRHTFASHFLAAYGEDATKSAMGHTPGSTTLFRHYRKAVTTGAGRKFFSDSAG
jgi:integrase